MKIKLRALVTALLLSLVLPTMLVNASRPLVVAVTADGSEMHAFPYALQADKEARVYLYKAYKLKDTATIKMMMINERKVETIEYAVVRLNANQTPVFYAFDSMQVKDNEAFNTISLEQLKKCIPNGEPFMTGYVYHLIVRVKHRDGTYSEEYSYRFMVDSTTYVEPDITVKYGNTAVKQDTVTDAMPNTDLVISASHRTSVEYLIYYFDDEEIIISSQPSITIKDLEKLPAGKHTLHIRALAASEERTRGTSDFPDWQIYEFKVTGPKTP